jgi:hypothetical protein
MGFFSFLTNNSPIKGEIGFFGLSDWWLSEFTEKERNHILKTFKPLGTNGDSLIKGDILDTSESAIRFLSILSEWFNKNEDRTIAYRMLDKAENMLNDSSNILDRNILYHCKVGIYYKNRDNDPDALEKTIEACKQQIEIAPKVKIAFLKEDLKLGIKNGSLPAHKGFEQLAIIEEKHKRFESAILLSMKALEQGWAGEWDKRIERCKKKLNKL